MTSFYRQGKFKNNFHLYCKGCLNNSDFLIDEICYKIVKTSEYLSPIEMEDKCRGLNASIFDPPGDSTFYLMLLLMKNYELVTSLIFFFNIKKNIFFSVLFFFPVISMNKFSGKLLTPRKKPFEFYRFIYNKVNIFFFSQKL